VTEEGRAMMTKKSMKQFEGPKADKCYPISGGVLTPTHRVYKITVHTLDL
jgi:hypothetical protein